MKAKEKEMRKAEKLKRAQLRLGVGATAGSGALGVSSKDFGSSAFASSLISSSTSGLKSTPATAIKPTLGGGKALKLGAKLAAGDDLFVQQLRSEGQDVTAAETPATTKVMWLR